MHASFKFVQLLLFFLFLTPNSEGADFFQFRGKSGQGIDTQSDLPTQWSDDSNLIWKSEIAGRGSSSPIVVGDQVFLTAYSGYGNLEQSGSQDKLVRQLLCYSLKDGKQLWKAEVENKQQEDVYQGFITEHGYATSTPVSDGESVFVFFGKSGVLAFDMNGKQKWHVSVGKESAQRRWGSAPSLVLHQDSVIVNASDESQTLYALSKKDGSVVWKAEAAGLENSFNTPLLVPTADRTELIVAVPWEIWSLDADTGKLLWYAETDLDNNVSPSMVANNGVIYAVGGRSGASIAIRLGGQGDVTKTHIVWRGEASSYVPSPVFFEDRLYWVNDRGIAHCVNAKTGDLIYQHRLNINSGGGRSFYASAMVIGGKIYVVSRFNGTIVYEPGDEFKQVAQNQLNDESMFNASPAVVDGKILIRSDSALYCIGSK
ncbi:MAG: PQQ-binding-like beta-propeller repeat protein [Planctomycetota bacterium]|nr:PQQ-binding-like beta-propeller repeat protein [Planctomycetota bacterium]